jgi:hypothetical protein
MSKEFRTVTVPIEAVPDPESAKKHRARQTLNNLLLALAASLGIMLAIVLAVPRDDSNRIAAVDYRSIAAQAQSSTTNHILVPKLDDSFKSNSARWSSAPADGVQNWYVGFVNGNGNYIGMTQAFNVNPTWLTLQTTSALLSSQFEIRGYTWQEFVSPVVHSPAETKDYILVLKNGNDAVLLYGTADKAAFKDFATRVVTALEEANNAK